MEGFLAHRWALKETPPVKCHGLGGRSGVQDLGVLCHNLIVLAEHESV
ncbi:MAG: hypothetical protein ACLQNE_06350 [Thermoguttaceae bacterium]|jgi:hypothetical protein